MKIFGWVMRNKMLTAIIAIMLVLALYFSMSGTSFDDISFDDIFSNNDDGTPSGTVTFTITDEKGNQASTDIKIEELSGTQTIFPTIRPFTTYSKEFVGISDYSYYSMGFSLTGEISPKDNTTIGETEPLTVSGKVTGITNEERGYDSYGYGSFTDVIYMGATATPNEQFYMETDVQFDKVGGGDTDLRGYNINDSTIYIVITASDTATGGLTYYGITEITVILLVNADGNLEYIVDSFDSELIKL